MKKFLLIIVALAYSGYAHSQNVDLEKIADSIHKEGLILYKSEWASWYGTDLFTEKCQEKRLNAGGYISYDTGTGENNIFFSKGENPVVLATISYGYDFDPKHYKLDTVSRKLSKQEKALYIIRQKALTEVNKDTLFKKYNNASLNLIPVVNQGKKTVYILTGPKVSGVVLFGNDYLIDFDEANNIVTKRKLHKNLIPVSYKKNPTDSSKIVLSTIHSHLASTGDFITATDICTLLLYGKFTTWNQHIVLSEKYTSVWNCKNNTLRIFKKEDWLKSNPLRNALEASH